MQSQGIAHIVETGQREGLMRACDIEVNARVILSLVTWAPLARPWAHATGALGHSRLTAAAVATLLDGMGTQPHLPQVNPLDLSALAPRIVNAFDRAGALEAKREALIREASRLFNRKGIDATSLDEIAAQVGATNHAAGIIWAETRL